MVSAHAVVDGTLVRQQRERVGDAVPAERLAEQHQQVDAVAAGCDAVEDVVEVLRRDGRRDVAPPQADVEIGVLGAEELHDVQRADVGAAERPEERRLAVVVEADDDERRDPGARADVLLPGGEKVEALIGRCERAAGLETAPERLRRRHGRRILRPRRSRRRSGGFRASRPLAGLIADCNIHLDARLRAETALPFDTAATLANNYQ